MATVAMSVDELQEHVEEGSILLLDFWADWCAPCHQFAPIYEEASERHDDVTFGKVDAEANPELTGQLGIQSIPTLVAIREGVVLYKEPGVVPGEGIDDLLQQIRDLDMEQIHAEIAEQEASSDGEPPQ